MTYLNPFPGKIIPENSSTTPLSASATYTGDWIDVKEYDSVVVAISTDKNGTYSIQFSPDGVNQDSTLTRYHKTNEINVPHRFTITRQYFRVSFTNTDSTDQTYFRLQSMVGVKQPLNVPLDGVVAQDYDATVVRPTNYHHEVSLGLRQGSTAWNKFGYNNDIDSGTEVIAAFGGSYVPPTSVQTLRIVSTSDSDGSVVGTGARMITIVGVDGDRAYQTDSVLTSGTTSVATTTQWLGINRMYVSSSGSNQANVGSISALAISGSVLGSIPPGESVTQQLIFHTQANHKGMADWMIINAQREGPATPPIVTFKGWVFNPTANTKYEVFRQIVNTNVDDHMQFNPTQPFPFQSGEVFWVEATTDQNNTQTSGRFSLIEYKDVDA